VTRKDEFPGDSSIQAFQFGLRFQVRTGIAKTTESGGFLKGCQ